MRAVITDNVGAANGMSHQVGANGAEIASLARTAFVDSMSGALWIAAAAAVIATFLAVVYLPREAQRGHGGDGTAPSDATADGLGDPSRRSSVHAHR